MSSNRTPTLNPISSNSNFSSINNSTTASTDDNNSKAKTSTQAQRQQPQQPTADYWTSPNTSSSNSTQPTMSSSSATSTRSPASSIMRGSSSMDSQRPLVSEPRRTSIERAMDKARSKFGRSPAGAEPLAKDELEYERQRAKAAEKQQRKEDYERLQLGKQTKYGMPGGMSFNG